VDALWMSDRSVSELMGLVQLPSNLLAHHLDTLEDAGLIERTVSAADRRRRYVRLRGEAIEARPCVRPSPSGRVVFVCSRNSARSQMAAAMWRARFGGRVTSAGTHPGPAVHAGAIVAAQRVGLDLARTRPRLVTPSDLAADTVVTVCDRAHEELEPGDQWWHWSIPDPVAVGTRTAFDAALRRIRIRIERCAPAAELRKERL
jgi:protein-tyrosine-phosphatase